MAFLGSGTVGNSTPKLAYELYAENVGASGNLRTIRVIVKFKVNGGSASYYGYPCNWRARIQTPYEFVYGGWTQFKGTETWNGSQGWRQFSQDITFDSKTTSAIAVVPAFETNHPSYSDWNGSGSHGNFGTVTTNTAPYFPSGSSITIRNGSASGAVLSGTIPENVNTIHVSWSSAKDNEGGTLRYWLLESWNGGGWNQKYSGGTATSCTYNINSGNEGSTYKWYVDCRDSSDALSGKVESGTLTKNRFTQATLSSSSSIGYDTGSISFSYSGASNTNGNTSFTYKLSCSEVTVYNQTVSGTSTSVTIYKSGTAPTTPYIKFDDIKNKFKGSSYKGTLNFTLTTTNAYGTSKTSSKSISVDLRTSPNTVSSCSISGDKSLSTCIKTTADTSSNYYIPDGTKVVRVVWSGGSCKLGSTITYDIQVKYGSGSFSNIATGLSSSTTYYNHVVPKQTVSQSLVYRIIVKTSFGYTSSKDTAAVTLHYYNSPSITVGTITRAETTASVIVTVKTNSSIPNINTTGSWKMSTTNQTGSLTVSQTAQTISTTGLTGAGTYTLAITYNDKTGFASNKTQNVSIGANLPVLDINKYGIGVNGVYADSNWALNVKSSANIPGGVRMFNNTTDVNLLGNRNYVTRCGTSVANRPSDWTSVFNMGADSNSNAQLGWTYGNDVGTLYFRKRHDTTGDYKAWQKVYTSGNKPTPSEIGAVTSSTGGNIVIHADNDASSTGEYAMLKAGHNELKVASSAGGSTVTRGQDKLSFNGNVVYHAGNWQVLARQLYPVGAIYMSTSSTNPSSIFGGTWEAWGSGRVPVGVNTSDSDFNSANKTGGAKTQDLRALIGAVGNNVGALGYQAQGVVSGHSYTNGYGISGNTPSRDININHSTAVKQSSGSDATTVQPYVTCYMWRRTA